MWRPQARPILRSKDMDDIFLQSNEWIRQCLSDHRICISASGVQTLPKRLLNIAITRGDENRVQIECVLARPPDYCALSYCWGDDADNFGRTVKANIQERIIGFQVTDLPKTIRDTIFLCRRLGISYLWVDSVCIVQDDKEEWKAESALMDQIYSQALFTVAAIASRHANEGLFESRFTANGESWQPHRPHRVRLNPHRLIKDPWVFLDIETSVALKTTMSSRAWTLQEEILSPKKLYWTLYGVMWSCPTHERREWLQAEQQTPARDLIQIKHVEGRHLDFSQRRYAAFVLKNASPELARRAWGDALTQYLPRRISRSEDRLTAIGGLVKVLQPQLQDTYIAGLWLQTLPEDLLWRTSKLLPENATERRPSWSWASLPSSSTASAWLGYSESQNIRSSCKVLDVAIEPPESAVFGPIDSGRVRLRAKKRPFPHPDDRKYVAAMGPGPAYDCISHYIAVKRDLDVPLHRLQCLLILDLFGREFCLLVEPVDRNAHPISLKRMGVAEVISKSAPTAEPLICSPGLGDGRKPGSSELRNFPTDSYFEACQAEIVELV